MIGAEKVAAAGAAERRRPFVSCIRLNGVPILPPLMDKSTKSMAAEAKRKALQLEMQLGWTLGSRGQIFTETLAVERMGGAVQDGAGSTGSGGACGASPRCTCGGGDRPHFPRRFTSAPCLTDGSPNSVPRRAHPDGSPGGRSSNLSFTQSGASAGALRKCSSVENLQARVRSGDESAAECTRCRRDSEPVPAVTTGSRPFPLKRQRAAISKVRSPAKGKGPLVTYMKGGGTVSAESELSLTSASPQKDVTSRESDNSASDSTWAAGFYRQLFPLENGDGNFDSESSGEDTGGPLRGVGASEGASHSASSDYISARESGVGLLGVPPTSGADDSEGSGYRLVRQGSYVLDKPSEALLQHLKKQSASRPTQETSVQTESDVLELPDVGDDVTDGEAGSKVSELRERLRKRFDAAMETLLEKQRAEQEALALAFLRAQQSQRLLMQASAVINAAARGYLVRRLMRTKHVQDLIETMEESLKCIFELKGEALRPLRADQELYDRLLQQLTAACSTFYETFFDISTAERMKIIAADRERLKYLQLKAASLGVHMTRPAPR